MDFIEYIGEIPRGLLHGRSKGQKIYKEYAYKRHPLSTWIIMKSIKYPIFTESEFYSMWFREHTQLFLYNAIGMRVSGKKTRIWRFERFSEISVRFVFAQSMKIDWKWKKKKEFMNETPSGYTKTLSKFSCDISSASWIRTNKTKKWKEKKTQKIHFFHALYLIQYHSSENIYYLISV